MTDEGQTQYAVCETCGKPADGQYENEEEPGWIEWLCYDCSVGWAAL